MPFGVLSLGSLGYFRPSVSPHHAFKFRSHVCPLEDFWSRVESHDDCALSSLHQCAHGAFWSRASPWNACCFHFSRCTSQLKNTIQHNTPESSSSAQSVPNPANPCVAMWDARPACLIAFHCGLLWAWYLIWCSLKCMCGPSGPPTRALSEPHAISAPHLESASDCSEEASDHTETACDPTEKAWGCTERASNHTETALMM
eukprot:918765-Rhodomonas_salina.1